MALSLCGNYKLKPKILKKKEPSNVEAGPTGGPPDSNGEMGYPYIKLSPLPGRAKPEVIRVFESGRMFDILRGSALGVAFLPGPCQARARGGNAPSQGGDPLAVPRG